MGNVERSRLLIAELVAAGVREFCVCAGSRNAPLLAVLGASDLRLFSFVDERSATFFALGRVKLHGAPVAVVTTSGTAVAEMLPGAIEAHYSGIPLVLISADRPARFRGTAAPQCVEQEGLFGVYAETSLERWSRTRPLHINIEFDEPLLDEVPVIPSGQPNLYDAANVDASPLYGVIPRLGAESPAEGQRSRASAGDPALKRGMTREGTAPGASARPLILIGALAPHHRERVRDFVLAANAPTFAEPLSGLREDSALPLITSGERMIARANFDSVIRIGNVPTLRLWRDLDSRDIPIAHFTDLPFAGLTRGAVHPIEALPTIEGVRDESFFEADRQQAARFEQLLDEEPESELSMFRALSRELAEGTRVYLGNSLPVREWDLAATREPRGFVYEANRGANGIDGQLSTFLGWCDPSRDNVCVLGDLTTIYDLNAPWIVPQLGHKRFRIVVMNNGGGRIFSRVTSLRTVDAATRERIFVNVHDVRFEHWAAMWNIDVTELRPDAEASKRVWARYDGLWS